jgi:hypothetical protein
MVTFPQKGPDSAELEGYYSAISKELVCVCVCVLYEYGLVEREKVVKTVIIITTTIIIINN